MRPETREKLFGTLLAIILIVGIVLRVASFNWNQRLQGDVNLFALTAREFVQHDRLYYPLKWEFSDYVPYVTLASPASQHPPLWPLAAGLLGKLLRTDDTFPILKGLDLGIGLALLGVVAISGLRRRWPVETLAATAFLAFSPALIDFSANGSSYILSALVLVLAAVLIERFRADAAWHYALAGALCGFALQVHSVLVLLPLAFLVFWIRRRDRRLWKGVLIAAIAGIVTLLPWLIWNMRQFGQPLYSYSTSFFLEQFGLVRRGVFGDIITTRWVRPIDAVFLRDYVQTIGATAAWFARAYLAEIGPFAALLASIGCVGLLRKDRRWLFALIVPAALYAITVAGWATARERFLAPALPAAYLCGASGLAYIVRRRWPWPVAGWLLLAGALAWNVPALLDQPPTRYYRDDAAWAVGYARMRSLVADLSQRERDVVLSYSFTLDGGMETVYWHRFPLVYGRELPLDAVQKAARDFDPRYVWADTVTIEQARATFPGAREILANEQFYVLELPAFRPVELGETSTALPAKTIFGDRFELVGYQVQHAEDALLLGLIWRGLAPQPPAVQFFVHLTDDAGQMIAQQDGPLARWSDDVEANWPAGQLLRQRARLPLPPGTDLASAQVYVGLYNSRDGQRLAVTVNGAAQGDGRYRLWRGRP